MKLYRHYDKQGVLLYVGITLSTIVRLRQHRSTAHWYNNIARVEITSYPNRAAAVEAERIAILVERPLHNIVHGWVTEIRNLPAFADPETKAEALASGQPHFAVLVRIARDIPATITSQGPRFYRKELARRLSLRGWHVRFGVKLESGSRGDNTAYRGCLDMLTYPPAPNPKAPDRLDLFPILVEIERNAVAYRTRAKIQAYGARPHRGVLVIVLYRPEAEPCPESTMTLALGQTSRLTKIRQWRKNPGFGSEEG